MASDPLRLPLRWAMRSIQQLRRLAWRIRKPSIAGAHTVAVTPQGKVILVKLRYAPGWSVPGGGRPIRLRGTKPYSAAPGFFQASINARSGPGPWK